MRRTRRIISVGLGSALVVVALGACGSQTPVSEATQGGAAAEPDAESTPTTSADDPGVEADPAYGGEDAGKPLAPVALGKPSTIGESASQGVAVVVTGWHEVKMPAGMPGEIAGPGLAFEVKATNNSDEPLDLSNVVADLRIGADETPTMYTSRGPTEAFSGTLRPGQSATATYAYNLDPEQRSDLTFYISLTADLPVVVFKGNAN